MSDIEKLCRPIVGIEHRTALEVFDIMSDRIRSALVERKTEPVAWTNAEQLGFLRQFDNPMAMWGKQRAEFGATIPLYSTPPAAAVDERKEV